MIELRTYVRDLGRFDFPAKCIEHQKTANQRPSPSSFPCNFRYPYAARCRNVNDSCYTFLPLKDLKVCINTFSCI